MEKHCDFTKCIHCKKCTRHCSFLSKYDISIGDMDKLRKLAYHCFLCGECTRVCPKDIDGRQIILDLRKEEIGRGRYGLKQKGYGGLLLEKKNYLFQNYRKGRSRSLLFPGCNFPSFFPKTTALVAKLLKEKADIDTVYDCCGKPIAELGLVKEEENILGRIRGKLKERGVTELVLLCPNCFYHFGDRLGVRITSIYEKLRELGLGKVLQEQAPIYLPCPDRENKIWVEYVRPYLPAEPDYVKDVQCCGLGGCAIVKERQLALDMPKHLQEKYPGAVHTYCGTCAGNFHRQGCVQVSHFLPLILESREEPDGKHSWMNRVKTKFL